MNPDTSFLSFMQEIDKINGCYFQSLCLPVIYKSPSRGEIQRNVIQVCMCKYIFIYVHKENLYGLKLLKVKKQWDSTAEILHLGYFLVFTVSP